MKNHTARSLSKYIGMEVRCRQGSYTGRLIGITLSKNRALIEYNNKKYENKASVILPILKTADDLTELDIKKIVKKFDFDVRYEKCCHRYVGDEKFAKYMVNTVMNLRYWQIMYLLELGIGAVPDKELPKEYVSIYDRLFCKRYVELGGVK